jgi:WD40 repeat protein
MLPLAAALAVSYLRDIVPILRDNCLACHSSETKQGGLVMDSYESLMKGGKNGPAILAGKGAESRLVLMLRGKVQPPMPLGNALPPALVDTMVSWIDAGAPGPAPGETTPSAAVRIPDIKPRKAVNPLVASLAFSPDGRVLAAGRYKEAQLLDSATQKVLASLPGHADVVRALAFSPDGKLLAAAGGAPAQSGEVIVWSLDNRERRAHLRGHNDAIYAVAFSHDSARVATASYDKLIRLWDATSGKEVATLQDHIDSVFALAFSPDGTRLASGAADRTVKVWEAATGQRLFTLSESQDAVLSLAFHPSGRQLAAGCADKFVRIWQLSDKGGTLLHSMAGHEDAILRLAYSPDGKRLVTSSADRTIRVWNAETLEELQVLGPQPDWVSALTFSPDGKRLAAGRFDGSIALLQP